MGTKVAGDKEESVTGNMWSKWSAMQSQMADMVEKATVAPSGTESRPKEQNTDHIAGTSSTAPKSVSEETAEEVQATATEGPVATFQTAVAEEQGVGAKIEKMWSAMKIKLPVAASPAVSVPPKDQAAAAVVEGEGVEPKVAGDREESVTGSMW